MYNKTTIIYNYKAIIMLQLYYLIIVIIYYNNKVIIVIIIKRKNSPIKNRQVFEHIHFIKIYR